MEVAHLPVGGNEVARSQGLGPHAQAEAGRGGRVGGEAEEVHQLARIFVHDGADFLGGQIQRLVPGDLHPARIDVHALLGVGALHGRGDAVRVVQVHDGALAARAQGAGVGGAHGVALDVDDHAVLQGGHVVAVAALHALGAVAEHLVLAAGVGEVLRRERGGRLAAAGKCAEGGQAGAGDTQRLEQAAARDG